MTVTLRAVAVTDLAALHTLNTEAVPTVNRIRLAEFDWFRIHAPYFRVAASDSGLLGFLIALLPGLGYDSPNYRWFEARGGRFLYIDRIVVAAPARGMGIGRMLYDDLAAFGGPVADRLTCEVNLRPANPGSVSFHRQMGFTEVGRQETEGGTKEVLLMEKPLPARP